MTGINPAQRLRNPSLTLYAFHLRSDITQKVQADAAHLWEKFEQLAPGLQIPELNELRDQLICYQNGEYDPDAEDGQLPGNLSLLRLEADSDFSPVTQSDGLELRAMVDPYRIHDTYAADLTLFYEDILTIQQLGRLNPQGCLLPENIQPSLGQTLILFAEPVGEVEDYQLLASECVSQLLQGTNSNSPQLIARGILCGSQLFEYDTLEEDPSLRCHIWVWFGREESLDQIQQASGYLLNMLCCRHKIIYIWYQSRYCAREGRWLDSQLEKDIHYPQPSDRPSQRQQLYLRYLQEMKDHELAIAINADNYRTLLNIIPEGEGDDRHFLERLLKISESKYLQQIQADISFLELGRDFFCQEIGSMGVEAETQKILKKQAERSVRQQYSAGKHSAGQCVYLILSDGDLENGFPVNAQIWRDRHPFPSQFTGNLPPAPELTELYHQWKEKYEELRCFKHCYSPLREITFDPNQKKNLSAQEIKDDIKKIEVELKQCFNTWLKSEVFRNIAKRIYQAFQPTEEVRVIIQTSDIYLRHLPWHIWEFFEHYPKAEPALSQLEGDPAPKSAGNRTEVRILSILSNSEDINVEPDREAIKNLPDAEAVFLEKPTRRKLYEHLWDEQGWDILCFSGHSSSEADDSKGWIGINETDKLTIAELKNALRKAIKRGLKLAIFNSCNGLGLASQLAEFDLPAIVVMRELVPDKVAQDFLQNFLFAFARGTSLYVSVREVREKLQKIEHEFPSASWLPVICQNPAELPVSWQDLKQE